MKKLKVTAKQSRREGVALSDAAGHIRSLARRPYAPGVHGPSGRGRMTDYGKQLREKQKAKRLYGMNERQFSNLFEEVSRRRGNTGEMLVQALEARLDNVVYRAGLVKTRGAARQVVSHAHFDVNGKKVNIPSYRVRAGDVITIRQNKRSKGNWKTVEETLKTKMGSGAVSWLTVDPVGPAIKVTGAPVGGELQQAFDPKMIVEFYSR